MGWLIEDGSVEVRRGGRFDDAFSREVVRFALAKGYVRVVKQAAEYRVIITKAGRQRAERGIDGE